MEIGRDRETDRQNARAKSKMVRVKVYGDRGEGDMIGVWFKAGRKRSGMFLFPCAAGKIDRWGEAEEE
jgi:hypothetical protein